MQLEDVWDMGALGSCRGSGGKSYEVEVDWEEAQFGFLEASCECPFFLDHGLGCKHLWAFLLLLDRERISEVVPGKGPLTLDEDDLDYSGFDEHPARASPKKLAGSMPPVWKIHLESIRQRKFSHEAPGGHSRRQLWLALIPETLSATGDLVVTFYCREHLKSGELGKLKPAKLGAADLERFEPEDQELLRYLLGLSLSGGPDPDDAWYPYLHTEQSSRWRERRSSVSISQLILGEVFPRLCGSGRFGWFYQDRGELVPIEWNPESVRWVLDTEDSDEQLSIRGGYAPLEGDGSIVWEVSEPVLVLESGWVLFMDFVVRLVAGPKVIPWIQLFTAQGPLNVPQADVPEALKLLLGLGNLPELRLPDRFAAEAQVEDPGPRLKLQARQGLFFGKVSFLYGDRSVAAEDPVAGWYDEPAGRVVYRRREFEQRKQAELIDLAPTGSIHGGHVTLTADHFADVVRRLHDQGWEVEVDSQRVKSSRGFSSRIHSGIDWFELSGRMDFGESQVELPALLTAVRRRSQTVTLRDGSVGVLPEDWLRRFGSLARITAGNSGAVDKGSLRFERQQALLLDALLADIGEVDLDSTFDRLRQRLRSFSKIEPASTPSTLQGTLRPYQKEGLGWLLWLAELGLGGCLADDMGLGKTIQVLAFLEQRRLAGESVNRSSILVVPRSLLRNWVAEGQRFTPDLSMHMYHGPERRKALEELSKPGEPCVLVTTYGTLRRDIVVLQAIEFDVVVLDEAQAIKNAASQTAKACRLVRAKHRLALTGTPIENHLGELWSLFEFLNSGMLGRLPALAGVAGKPQLPAESLELVARALRPLVLRRTKQQVLRDLPAKTEQILLCELSTAERKRYDELRNHYRARLTEKVRSVGLGRSKIQVLEALLRLRQASCHAGLLDRDLEKEPSAKLGVLRDRLHEVVEEGDKALVFSQFTRFLALVRHQLDKDGLTYEYLDGRTRNREERVERFQTDPDCKIFLISLKAGGVGLNLTAASYVFLLDPWWNPAVESQAIDRVHRIGQDRPVFAYRLIARDTVEEKILQMQEMKRSLAEAVLTQDRRMLGQMTSEDLELLLGGPIG